MSRDPSTAGAEGFVARFTPSWLAGPAPLLAASLFTALALGLLIHGSLMASAAAPSSAGALGPMQFLPTTWARYGTYAEGGVRPDGLRSALWNCNHSTGYVEQVVRVAGLAF